MNLGFLQIFIHFQGDHLVQDVFPAKILELEQLYQVI